MVFFFSKLNTDSLIRNIYHNICMLIPKNICFRKFINWERKGNFKNKAIQMPLVISSLQVI